MQKILLFFALILFSSNVMAQCSELFFSEYVEGYANNKALEIYNPTDDAINLSGYSIARFSNGGTTAGTNKVIQLPDVMLEAHDVFVVVVALTDVADWNSQFDKPAWNGYNQIDTLFDNVTGEPILNDDGEVIFGPQYLDGSALFGDEYNEEYDLQCKADAFLCPDYDTNNAMYFNGNDAMALIIGTELLDDGSNLIDVIGVIGEDPEDTIMQDAWVNADGFWLTKDRTLVRKPDVEGGRAALEDVVFSLGGTFVGEEWESWWKNAFQFLGIHNSVCAEANSGEWSCITGPVIATEDINQIPFKMYPNPNASNVLSMEADQPIKRVEIYNVYGQKVLTEQIVGGTNYADIRLNILGAGMYMVNLVFDENQISIQKLIIE
jgi:hypothetical protein